VHLLVSSLEKLGELAIQSHESGHSDAKLAQAIQAVQRGDIQALLNEVQRSCKTGSQSLSPEMLNLTKYKVRGCLALLEHAGRLSQKQ
jgi:hypothetical protein